MSAGTSGPANTSSIITPFRITICIPSRNPDAPWYAWEWLTDVIDGSLHRLAGLKGIVLLAGVVIALFATTLIRRMVWRGVHLFVAMVVALLAVGAASIHFLARPHIFTLLLLSISVWMIEADREAAQPPDLVAGPDHRGVDQSAWRISGADRGAGAGGGGNRGRSAGWARAQWRDAVRYARLTAACAAASLVNPYGYGCIVHVVEYLRSDWIRNVIQEFQSPSFRNENMLQFEALLLVGLIAAGLLFRRVAGGGGAVDRVLRAHGARQRAARAAVRDRDRAGDRGRNRGLVERLDRGRDQEIVAGRNREPDGGGLASSDSGAPACGRRWW